MIDIPNLKEITYELTTNCGAQCVMCARNRFSRPGLNMSFDDIEAYVKKTVEMGYNAIILGGMGDPLCFPQLCEFLEYIKTNYPNLSIRLTTTGQLFDEKNLEVICKNVDILKISNYGFTKGVYEAVHRGSLDFDSVQEKLRYLVDLKCRKPYIIMSYLDMDINHSEVEPWIEYWSGKDISEVNVWKMHNWGGYVAEREHLSEVPAYCERIRNKHFKLWVDGSLTACVFDCEQTLYLGNMRTDTIESIMDKYNSIKCIHDKGNVAGSGLICSRCDQIFSRSDALLYLCENGIVKKEYKG